MAKTPVSQEEIQLRKRARRRLVGAIALVLIAIVILPMVLDGEPRQRPENINIQIPPIPPLAPVQGAAPAAPTASPEHPAAPARAGPTAVAPAPAAAPAAPEPAAGVPAPAPPAPAPAGPRTVAAAASESLVIQIGCFSDAAKSRALVSQIKANKISAFSEPAGREHSCTRVRAGPFPSQDAANGARERLLKLKLIPPPSEGKIVRRGD